jgi:hypothetical protein
MEDHRRRAEDLLAVYGQQLAALGAQVVAARQAFVDVVRRELAGAFAAITRSGLRPHRAVGRSAQPHGRTLEARSRAVDASAPTGWKIMHQTSRADPAERRVEVIGDPHTVFPSTGHPTNRTRLQRDQTRERYTIPGDDDLLARGGTVHELWQIFLCFLEVGYNRSHVLIVASRT